MNDKTIDKKVSELKDKVNSTNIKDYLDYLNIKLIVTDKVTTQFTQNKDKKIIYLNKDIPEDLREFVIAHEIGHAILHNHELMHYSPLTISKSNIERQADYFAFKLLDKKIDPTYEYTISQYSKILGVNEEIIKCVTE